MEGRGEGGPCSKVLGGIDAPVSGNDDYTVVCLPVIGGGRRS